MKILSSQVIVEQLVISCVGGKLEDFRRAFTDKTGDGREFYADHGDGLPYGNGERGDGDGDGYPYGDGMNYGNGPDGNGGKSEWRTALELGDGDAYGNGSGNGIFAH
jgi:hypothetical protein